jgi:hypothetical protein
MNNRGLVTGDWEDLFFSIKVSTNFKGLISLSPITNHQSPITNHQSPIPDVSH